MPSMRRSYVASTSLQRHVPAGNLPPLLAPPPPPQYSKPCPPPNILTPIHSSIVAVQNNAVQRNARRYYKEQYGIVEYNTIINGWMEYLQFYGLQLSFSQSSRWEGNKERLCAMETQFTVEQMTAFSGIRNRTTNFTS